MKIEEGMYVRTKNGIIFKYYPCRNNEYDEEINIYSEWDDDGRNYDCYTIANASYNIIDLIEVGDYVNGLPVVHNAKNNGGNIVIVVNGDAYNEEEIKSILTKKQYENNCYKVEE